MGLVDLSFVNDMADVVIVQMNVDRAGSIDPSHNTTRRLVGGVVTCTTDLVISDPIPIP